MSDHLAQPLPGPPPAMVMAAASPRPFDQRLEQAAGLTALALLAFGCFLVVQPFLSGLAWGVILAYSTWPLYQRLVLRLRGRRSLAAALMTLLLALAFVLPIAVVGNSAAEGVTRLIQVFKDLFAQGLPPLPGWLAGLPLIGPLLADVARQLAAGTSGLVNLLQPYASTISDVALGVGLSVGSGLVEVSLSVFAAFFFYRDGGRFVRHLRAVMGRLFGDRADELLEVAGTTTTSVVYGIVGTALIQGIASAFGFWISGVPSPFVLGFLCFVLGLLPLGPPLVWGPLALWKILQGDVAWGLFLLAWGMVVVSSLDNFIRPWLISRGSAELTFLPVFLGVVGGAVAFGFLGIFLGPVLLMVGLAIVGNWLEPAAGRSSTVPAMVPGPIAPSV